MFGFYSAYRFTGGGWGLETHTLFCTISCTMMCHRCSEEAGELWVRQWFGEDSKEAGGIELGFNLKNGIIAWP